MYELATRKSEGLEHELVYRRSNEHRKSRFCVRIFNSKWKKFKSVTYIYQPYVSIYQDRPDINRLNPIQLPELFGTNWVLYLHLVCLNMFFFLLGYTC